MTEHEPESDPPDVPQKPDVPEKSDQPDEPESPENLSPAGTVSGSEAEREEAKDREPLRVSGNVRALVIEHAEHEGPGLLGDSFHVRRAVIDRRRMHRGDSLPASIAEGGYNAVVVLGGPMSAWDDEHFPFLAAEARLLAEAARAGVATLGICLGAQLLARGMGARVYRGAEIEIGIAPIILTDDGRADRLFQPLDAKDVLHWHADTFDLPDGAVLLASTARYPHQAFRLGPRAYGLQFHVECDTAQRRVWGKLGERELRQAGVPPASLSAFSTTPLDDRGRQFASAFVRLIQHNPP